MANGATTNYSWILPEVGSDAGAWGGHLNSNLTDQDTTVKAISDVADAALPKAGGTMSGDITFSQAAAKIIPGATSFTVRDHADAEDNLYIADSGDILTRGDLGIGADLDVPGNAEVHGALTVDGALTAPLPAVSDTGAPSDSGSGTVTGTCDMTLHRNWSKISSPIAGFDTNYIFELTNTVANALVVLSWETGSLAGTCNIKVKVGSRTITLKAAAGSSTYGFAIVYLNATGGLAGATGQP